MKSRLLLALAGLLLAAVASAHSYPARRSIAVQSEKNAVVVLAVWTAPAGEIADVFEIGAALRGRGRGKTKPALEAQLAAKALGPLAITLDGKALAADSIRTRLIEEPPRSGRRAIAVLLEAKIPEGEHEVSVNLGPTGDATRMNYIDKSLGAADAAGRVPEGGVVPPGTGFKIRWKKDRK